MADRILAFPTHLFRWLTAPAALGALGAILVACAAHLRRRSRQPNLPRMSEEWLHNLDRDPGDRLEYWRDSW